MEMPHDDALFDAWIDALFNHAEEDGDWRFDYTPTLEEALNPPEELTPEFIYKLNQQMLEISPNYNDWQLAMGLSYIYDPACSDLARTLQCGPAPLSIRLQAVSSMKNIYTDCFELRCLPALGHLSEEGNELNGICYMLWDVTPIRSGSVEIYRAISELLEYVLRLKNIACIESALHGLGHLVYQRPDAAHTIQNFITKSKGLDPRLLRYAEAAKTGYIE
ncbi:MAG: hypothetical protein ACK4PK_08900 [Alphaproteobacteria bacterium]